MIIKLYTCMFRFLSGLLEFLLAVIANVVVAASVGSDIVSTVIS